MLSQQFLADGRCMLQARLNGRHRIIETYVEDGTQGLHYCTLEEFKDDPIAESDRAHHDMLVQQAKALVVTYKDLIDIESTFGPEPSDSEFFSLWLISILPTIRAREKMTHLRSQNTSARLTAGITAITQAIREVHNSGFDRAESASGFANIAGHPSEFINALANMARNLACNK